MPAFVFARRKAFSLTELLVVVAVILILAGLIFVGANTLYAQAMQVKCQHNLEQIGHACLMYASKNYGQFPKAWDMQNQQRWYDTLLKEGYVDSPAAIGCPLEPEPIPRDVETPASLTEPIIAGLGWLKRNQQPDGRWLQESTYRTAENSVTAMALMAFLGFGCTDKYPDEYKNNVRDAMDFLIGKQNATTGLWDNTHYYRTSICTMAMAWAAMMTGDSRALAAAEKGLTAILNNLSSTVGAWSYSAPTWYGDISVTSWAIQAVDACIKAGIPVPQAKLDLMEQGVINMVFPNESYRTPYRFNPGVAESSYGEGHVHYKESRHMAMSLACRLLKGHRPAATKDPVTPGGLFKGQLDWFYASESGERRYRRYATYNYNENFLYYYYYMTMAMSLLGDQNWADWSGGSSPIFPNQLIQHQRSGSTGVGGSWFEVLNSDGSVRSTTYGVCNFGRPTEVGRAYSTAFALMTLEAGIPGRWTVGGLIAGKCSYGYNVHLGKDRRTLKADTIVVIDYDHWVINRGIKASDGTFDPVRNDPPHYVAPRHGGRANILFGNGRVESLRPEDISEPMWGLDVGD